MGNQMVTIGDIAIERVTVLADEKRTMERLLSLGPILRERVAELEAILSRHGPPAPKPSEPPQEEPQAELAE